MDYFLHALLLIASILLIGKGSDWLTDSLVPLGRKLKVTSVSVGLVFVSIAVSLPEVLVALYAVHKGYPTITLGAIGPSIPNIVVAYKAAKRDMGEIAISETFGSNIFTLLVTFGAVAMLSPIIVGDTWLRFDLPALIGLSTLLLFFTVTRRAISRLEGGILLGAYLLILVIR